MTKVSVVMSSPATVLDDYRKVMELAEYHKELTPDTKTILKLNLSWSLFYPASSTSPWQLEGILKTLREDGYKDIEAMENKTVVTDPIKGAYNNRWLSVFQKYGVKFTPLTDVEWREFRPRADLMILGKRGLERLEVPACFLGTNIIHPPTQKTHGHSVITGAMKNAFGGLLKEFRHHYHTYIHEVLVDLLTIQKEIHRGIFAVMDGIVAGDGAGPRTHIPRIKNHILASADQVAIDAVSAKMMGFDPMSIPFIKMAHDRGLGCGDTGQIEILGDDISHVNYGFKVKRSPVIWGDQLVRKGSLRFLEPLMHTSFFEIPRLLSALYHDYYWYPLKGKKYVKEFMSTEWGRLFQTY